MNRTIRAWTSSVGLLGTLGVLVWLGVDPARARLVLHATGLGVVAQEADTDGDTLPDAWEAFFGLNPNDAGDATGDPDGDGLTNAQEFAARRHPVGRHARYFAEGSTGFFDTSIAIVNLSPTDTAHVALALLTDTGSMVSHQLPLGPGQRQTVSLDSVLGISAAVSIIVESDVPVAADRSMTWGPAGTGLSLDTGSPAPATTWYFAEGATGPFLLYYLFQNPAPTPANVTVRYLVEGAAMVSKTHTLPPQSRTTIFVNGEDPALVRASVGAVISSDVPILADRAMYVNAGGTLGGGTAASGVGQASTQWYFGEGATGPFFHAFLLLLNPGTTATSATVTYHLSDGTAAAKTYDVPAEGRRTVYFNDEAASDPALAALARGPVWFSVTASQPLVAERAMWWADWPWYEGHSATGATTAAVSWAVPEGRHGGAGHEQTYVLIGNTTTTPTQVRLTLLPDTGAALTREVPVAAGERVTLNVGRLFELPAAPEARFSILIDSGGTPQVPLAVDYARYRSVNGLPFSGGGAAAAIPLPGVNDPPSFTAGPDVTSDEDAGPVTVTPWATMISPGPADEAGQTVTFVVTGNTNAGLFSVPPALSPAGVLTYTSAPNAFGSATVTVAAQDNGGTDGGGVDTSPPQMFTITVNPVNDAPTVTAPTITYSTPGNTQLHVQGATLPGLASVTDVNGVLLKSRAVDMDGPGVATAVAQSGPTANGTLTLATDGSFTYVPNAGFNGTDTFTVQVTDSLAATPVTVRITVTYVVWYVNNQTGPNNPPGSDGRSTDAFESLAQAETASGTGDYIYVFEGLTATTPLVGGIALKNGQNLWGQGVDLDLFEFPNVVLATNAPRIRTTAAGTDVVRVPALTGDRTGVDIRGLDLEATGPDSSAIDVTSSGDNEVILDIRNNTIRGATGEGIDLNAGSTEAFRAFVSDNRIMSAGNGVDLRATGASTELFVVGNQIVTTAGNGIDLRTLAGASLLEIFAGQNGITAAMSGIVIDGSAAGLTTITDLVANTISGDAAVGAAITSVRFDANPSAPGYQTAGAALTIGTSTNPVSTSGLVLTNVSGNLIFFFLDVFAGNGTALSLTGTGPVNLGAGTGTRVATSTGTVRLHATGGPAVSASSATIDLRLSDMSATNTVTNGVSLTNVAGVFSAPFSTITKATGSGAAFAVDNSAAGTTVLTASYGGTITNTSATGSPVAISTADPGSTLTFTGLITGNPGQGISLTGNTGATISFSGGLRLTTGANPAFTATGGGTIAVCDENPCNPAARGSRGSTLFTTTGTALNVANTTIGPNNLEFVQIFANGAVNGIVLDNTGTSGRLVVTGFDGTDAGTAIDPGSGGTIQNTTGDGVSLTSTRAVSLTAMNVRASGNHGIHASGVDGLTLTNCEVSNSGDADNEHGLNLVNVSGTVTLSGTRFDNAAEDLVHLENSNTNVTFTVSNGSQFVHPDSIGALANGAIVLIPNGTSSVIASIQNTTFTNVANRAAQIGAEAAASNGTHTFTFANNTVNVTTAGRTGGVLVSGQALSTTNLTISNNTFTGAGGNGVITIVGNDESTVQGAVSTNTITNPPGDGILSVVFASATARVVLDGNTVTNAGGEGIHVANTGGTGTSTLQATVTNNQVAGHSGDPTVAFRGGISFVNREDASCLVLRGNTVTGTPADLRCRNEGGDSGEPCVEYHLQESSGGVATLEEVPDTDATTASVAYVQSTNSPSTASVTIVGTIDLTNGGVCAQPLSAGQAAGASSSMGGERAGVVGRRDTRAP